MSSHFSTSCQVHAPCGTRGTLQLLQSASLLPSHGTAAAAPGSQTSISQTSKYLAKERSKSPCLSFFSQTSHRRKGDSSCEQNGLFLPQFFLYKGNGFRSISVSLPSLTAQVWFPQACQLSCMSASHPWACRSCKSSRFGDCKSNFTQTSQGLLYSNLLAWESRCDLSNCHPCKINQRDENPLCHSSPLIKVLPPELSSQFCC